jgi:predicted RNA binding protein YcfA (HicA-like mRNA interferase family)
MPKLVSSRIIERILLSYGFAFVSQKGSHAKFVKGTRTVIVPMAKSEIPLGTLSSIARQSDIDVKYFQNKKK